MDYKTICQLEIKDKVPIQKVTLGVDETFFERMILVAMDLTSGFIFTETFSKERSFEAWKTATAFFGEWHIKVDQVVSDRAKALIKLAEIGWEVFHIPDLFHASREISLALGKPLSRRVQQAEKGLVESTKTLEKEERLFSHLTPTPREDILQAPKENVEMARKTLTAESQGQHLYRQKLQAVSMTLQPFSDVDSSKQTACQVKKRLEQIVQDLEYLKTQFEISDSNHNIDKFSGQIEGLSLSVTGWWNRIEQSLLEEPLNPQMFVWVTEILLPVAHWNEQLSRCDHPILRENYQELLQRTMKTYQTHVLTKELNKNQLEFWRQWAITSVKQFQRASSAVEGRNGYLAQIYHNRRGISEERLEVLTVIHNFVLKRYDGTTAAQRLYQIEFPDFWRYLLEDLPPLPRPRKRKSKNKPNPLEILDVQA